MIPTGSLGIPYNTHIPAKDRGNLFRIMAVYSFAVNGVRDIGPLYSSFSAAHREARHAALNPDVFEVGEAARQHLLDAYEATGLAEYLDAAELCR